MLECLAGHATTPSLMVILDITKFWLLVRTKKN